MCRTGIERHFENAVVVDKHFIAKGGADKQPAVWTEGQTDGTIQAVSGRRNANKGTCGAVISQDPIGRTRCHEKVTTWAKHNVTNAAQATGTGCHKSTQERPRSTIVSQNPAGISQANIQITIGSKGDSIWILEFGTLGEDVNKCSGIAIISQYVVAEPGRHQNISMAPVVT